MELQDLWAKAEEAFQEHRIGKLDSRLKVIDSVVWYFKKEHRGDYVEALELARDRGVFPYWEYRQRLENAGKAKMCQPGWEWYEENIPPWLSTVGRRTNLDQRYATVGGAYMSFCETMSRYLRCYDTKLSHPNLKVTWEDRQAEAVAFWYPDGKGGWELLRVDFQPKWWKQITDRPVSREFTFYQDWLYGQFTEQDVKKLLATRPKSKTEVSLLTSEYEPLS